MKEMIALLHKLALFEDISQRFNPETEEWIVSFVWRIF